MSLDQGMPNSAGALADDRLGITHSAPYLSVAVGARTPEALEVHKYPDSATPLVAAFCTAFSPFLFHQRAGLVNRYEVYTPFKNSV